MSSTTLRFEREDPELSQQWTPFKKKLKNFQDQNIQISNIYGIVYL